MIVVVDAGFGNLRSVEKALAQVGLAPKLTHDPDVIRRADKVVLPGQGAFKDCMQALGGGLDEVIREHIRAGKPYFGICLGLQILFEESEEQGPCRGLGILPGRVVKFPSDAGLKIPHMGWNQAGGEWFYFVHSYYVAPTDTSVVAMSTRYGDVEFCAAVRKDNIFATQFHPEKSQRAGLELLRSVLCS
jgi:imidazole glycerol-phosphate synthase subunit HisH